MSTDGLLAHWEGEPVQVWERLWGVPRLEVYRTISSTNDRVRELAEEGAPSFTAVLAEEQSAGRGRSGRSWHAPRESSLLVSFLLPSPDENARALTPLVVGIVVARAVEDVGVGPATLKWPNDVWLVGRKVAGILCEAGWGAGFDPSRQVVAGIGINVRQREEDFPPVLRDGAISLEMAGQTSVRRAELAGRLVTRTRELFSPAPSRLEGELAGEIRSRDALRGRPVVLENGVRGRAAGVAPDGALVVETVAGPRRVTAGSVRVTDPRES